jgi:hypothetical protein
MSTPSPARRRPGPRPSVPEVGPDVARLLFRLQRLRVMTPFQAHWLVEDFNAVNPETGKPRTERNTRMRLQRLAEEGFIKSWLTHPEKGGYSGIYYRLGGKGLRVLGASEDKSLLRRPPPLVLRYLLLRNEVYARAREAGWHVLSPVLSVEEIHPKLLEHFHSFWRRQLEARVREGQLAAREELDRLDIYLPKELTFDSLLRADKNWRMESLVLVIVDDPRRTVVKPASKALVVKPSKEKCPACGLPMTAYTSADRKVRRCTRPRCRGEKPLPSPARAQVDELPFRLPPGTGLLLRDSLSRWNVATGSLDRVSPRLRQWRRVLAARFGKDLLSTDTLFPDLWAERTKAPASEGSNTPARSEEDDPED